MLVRITGKNTKSVPQTAQEEAKTPRKNIKKTSIPETPIEKPPIQLTVPTKTETIVYIPPLQQQSSRIVQPVEAKPVSGEMASLVNKFFSFPKLQQQSAHRNYGAVY